MSKRLWQAACMALLLVVGVACTEKTEESPEDSGELGYTSYQIDPPEAGLGTEVTVAVRSSRSQYVFGETGLDFGEGIEVNNVTVQDGWTVVADLSIAEDAANGLRDVTLDIGGREVVLEDAFRVVLSSLAVAPDNGMIGETVDVQLTGTNTKWLAGRTWVSFGQGVDVLDFTVVSETFATARVAIGPDASPGLRDVYTEDGPKIVTAYDAFQVDRVGVAAVFEPEVAKQGEIVEFSVYGRDTNFAQGKTAISFFDSNGENGDVVVTQITVLDSENLWGRMQLSNAAKLGKRDVLIMSEVGIGQEEGVMLQDAFEVIGGDLDLGDVRISMSYTVVRGIDNSSGALNESVRASAVFWIPLDPPCGGGGGAPGSGPSPYDVNGVFPTPDPPEGGEEDCPNPQTVSAGDVVWLESSKNVVTLEKVVDAASGMIAYVGKDLTMADYATNVMYDLHLQGDPNGLPEEILPGVQPTVPCDWYLTSPSLWGNYTHNRAEDFEYTWGMPDAPTQGACTGPPGIDPAAIFSTTIPGTLVSTGKGGFAGALPWDDGVHTYTAGELSQLEPNPTSLQAYSYKEGPEFGLKDSRHQDNVAETYIYLQASLVLE
ncbi:MAG: hypothetical protein VXW32_15585 [Myxococcota bacterium]|nr:hypothetical protein [Myxococcota bacterium]